ITVGDGCKLIEVATPAVLEVTGLARHDLGFGQHEVAAEVTDVVDEAVALSVRRHVFEDVVWGCTGRAGVGLDAGRESLFDPVPLARKHVERIDAAAPLPAVAVRLLGIAQATHVALSNGAEIVEIAGAT